MVVIGLLYLAKVNKISHKGKLLFKVNYYPYCLQMVSARVFIV